MLYKFELNHNFAEATTKICRAKGECTIDPSTIIRWFKGFYLGCKNIDNQARLGKPKSMETRHLAVKCVLSPSRPWG